MINMFKYSKKIQIRRNFKRCPANDNNFKILFVVVLWHSKITTALLEHLGERRFIRNWKPHAFFPIFRHNFDTSLRCVFWSVVSQSVIIGTF